MATSRRSFLKSAAVVGCVPVVTSTSPVHGMHPPQTDYARLDAVLEQPVLKRELFSAPVVIESVELLRDRNNFLQIVQPDLFYFGGMIRTMQVARMAEAAGLRITPHISGGGLGYVYMLQMVSVCPAAAEYHEFKMFGTRDANGTIIPVESKAEPFECINGVIRVPSGTGLGVTIDSDYISQHTALTG